MEIFLIKLLQFMLAISILVLLHEGGHYIRNRLAAFGRLLQDIGYDRRIVRYRSDAEAS